MAECHDFNERLNFSQGVGLNRDILEFIGRTVPAFDRWEQAEKQDDRNGTDYWLFRKCGLPPLSVDMKNRDFCPIDRFGRDDACIELWSTFYPSAAGPHEHRIRNYRTVGLSQSVCRGRNVSAGWTVNYTKRTDYVVYTWPADNCARRYWIVPFPFLCQAALLNRNQWVIDNANSVFAAENRNYLTLSVYPTRKEITESIRPMLSGTVGSLTA